MSDLLDELYKESLLENQCKKAIEYKNEKREIKNSNGIKIRIKICEVGAEMNETGDDLIKIINRTNNSCSEYSFNDKSLKHCESKSSNRIYTIDVTECINILPELDFNKNSLNEHYKRVDEDNAGTVSLAQKNVTTSNCNITDDRKTLGETSSKSLIRNKEEQDKDSEKCYVIDINVPKEGNDEEMLNEQIETIKWLKHLKNNSNWDKKNIEFINSESIYYIAEDIVREIDDEDEKQTNLAQKDEKDVSNYVTTENKSISSSKIEEKENYEESATSDLKQKNETNYIAEDIVREIDVEDEKETNLTRREEKEVSSNYVTIKNKAISCSKIKKRGNYEEEPVTSDLKPKNNTFKTYALIHNTNDKITDYKDVNDKYKGKQTTYNSKITTSKLLNGNTDKQEKDKINSFVANKTRSTSSNVQCLTDEETLKDSLIIKDIVMKKYGGSLRQCIQRSLKRRQIRKRQSLYDMENTELKPKLNRPKSLDVKYLQCNKDFSHLLYNKTPDSGLESTQEFEDSSESLKYSPTVFLKEALGDEYLNITNYSEQENLHKRHSTPIAAQPYKQYSNGRSIGSSEISTLMSIADGVDSLYSTIDKSKKKRPSALNKSSSARPLFNRNTSDAYIYESIENFKMHPKSEELNIAISVQKSIIAQVSNALNLCRQSPVFFGSVPHLEAEKYLLFTTYKKIFLENQLNRDYEEMESKESYGCITVENLRFVLNTGHTMETNNVEEYYMCILHSDVTLLASNIVLPEKNGQIIFKQSFQFNNLVSDFEIYIKVFSMVLENKHKKILCLSPKIWKNRKLYNKRPDGLPEISSFRLIGTGKIGISDLYTNNSLYLEKTTNGRISDTFNADIQSSIKITNNTRGFLTIGTSNILWNRRWCALEGPFLKYWNYPGDENVKQPIGVFDLSNCIIHQITSLDKTVCSRPRTILLPIKSEHGTVTQYFLQADNSVEFEEWKRQLNSVLISLSNWKCLKY